MASMSDPAAAAVASSQTQTWGAEGHAAEGQPVEGQAVKGQAQDQGIKTVHPGQTSPRGAFIVLEGLDRSGKTTQVKLLEQRFVEEGARVKTMRFPDRSTPIGQMIDGYLRSSVDMEDHAIHLLFSANRWEAANHIRSLIASGTTVICDRFYHSGIVYSVAKKNPALGLAWARAPDAGLPRPDLVLFLDLGPEQARARGGWGAEKYEQEEMQRTVRELFWALSMGGTDIHMRGEVGAQLDALEGAGGAGNGGGAGGGGGGWRQDEEDIVVVDAGGSREAVAEDIWGKVRARVERIEKGEMGRVVRTAM